MWTSRPLYINDRYAHQYFNEVRPQQPRRSSHDALIRSSFDATALVLACRQSIYLSIRRKRGRDNYFVVASIHPSRPRSKCRGSRPTRVPPHLQDSVSCVARHARGSGLDPRTDRVEKNYVSNYHRPSRDKSEGNDLSRHNKQGSRTMGFRGEENDACDQGKSPCCQSPRHRCHCYRRRLQLRGFLMLDRCQKANRGFLRSNDNVLNSPKLSTNRYLRENHPLHALMDQQVASGTGAMQTKKNSKYPGSQGPCTTTVTTVAFPGPPSNGTQPPRPSTSFDHTVCHI